ncbi:MAG: hypothetical protein QF721_05745 [Verrucomicrobiota bacterium]|nr:hypothetical protein [Verrucomicrobiota bacterium]
MNAALVGLSFCLMVAPVLAQPAGPGSAETLANRLGQAIDNGDANAAFRLAELYRSGEGQLPVDFAKAVSLYKTAARLGNHPMAMNTLGLAYEQGWGVKASQALALQWYGKAARAGSALALANLGKIHAQGNGVLRDYRLAVVELKKAAGDWVTVRLPAADVGVVQDSPFRFSAASLMLTDDEPEIDWGYSRRVEWDEVPARKFVSDRQFDSAEAADITVADVRIDGDDLLLDIAVFGGVPRNNPVHFIWFFDMDGRESGVPEFRLHDAPPLKPERLPHADRALQIVLPHGDAAVLPVYLLSGAKPARLAEGRFFKGDNVAAQYDLGIIYAKGKKNPRDVGGDVKQNFRLASDWFFRAADPRPNHADYASGHAGAQNNLGVLYSKGNLYRREDRRSDTKHFEPKPHEQAALWFRRAAAQGYTEAYANLGFLYEQGMLLTDAGGRKVSSLYRKALGLYMRAADPEGVVRLKGEKAVALLRQNVPGLTLAQYNLGSLFDPDELITDGLPTGAVQEFRKNQSGSSAEFWYGQAAAKGHTKAQLTLAKRILKRPELEPVARVEPLMWLYLASDKSDAEAFRLLDEEESRFASVAKQARTVADLFLPSPETGGEPDEARRKLEALAASATAGDMQAAFEMGRAFHLGAAPARQDFTRAFRLYRLAAGAEHAAAQFHLGMLYSTGTGIPYRARRGIGGFANIKRAYNIKAVEWYGKAAGNGHGEAAYYLGNLYAAGSIELKQDYELALEWYRKADSLGNIDALNNLGYLHDEGLGTRRDRAKARDCYTRAAEAGHAGAQMNLSAYYFEGLGGLKKNLGTALAWARKAADQGEPGAAEKVSAITKLMQRGKK